MATTPPKTGAAASDPAALEPRFPLSRLLDPTEGELITGLAYPVIVGALAGVDDDAELTRGDVQAKADAFLKRPVKQGS